MWGGARTGGGGFQLWQHRVTPLIQTDGGAPPESCKDCGLGTVATYMPLYLWSSQLAKSVGKFNSWVACFNE